MAVNNPRIGLQLCTLKDDFEKHPFVTLRDVAAIGFEGVEFVGSSLRSLELEKLKLELTNSCLNVAGAAFEIEDLESNLDSILQLCHSINCPTIVMPSIRSGDCQSRSSLIDVALKMNYIASRCKTDGVTFLYHTHGFELQSVEGRRGLEWLSGCWNSRLIRLEVDTYWVEHSGVDAVGFMKQYGNQCSSIHFKDMNDTASKRETEIGAGILDLAGVANEAMRHDVEWFIVEQEEFDKSPIESAKVGFRNLTRIRNEALQAVTVS